MKITATVFYSYQVCPREAWFYHHSISSDHKNPYLVLGRLIHETSYERERKEIFVDGVLKIDLIRGEAVAEVKRSSRQREAARMQLLYYLWYLKRRKGLHLKGLLLFPRERRVEEVELTEEDERRIEDLLLEMSKVLSEPKPPPLKKNPYCKTCSFREFCWA